MIFWIEVRVGTATISCKLGQLVLLLNPINKERENYANIH